MYSDEILLIRRIYSIIASTFYEVLWSGDVRLSDFCTAVGSDRRYHLDGRRNWLSLSDLNNTFSELWPSGKEVKYR